MSKFTCIAIIYLSLNILINPNINMANCFGDTDVTPPGFLVAIAGCLIASDTKENIIIPEPPHTPPTPIEVTKPVILHINNYELKPKNTYRYIGVLDVAQAKMQDYQVLLNFELRTEFTYKTELFANEKANWQFIYESYFRSFNNNYDPSKDPLSEKVRELLPNIEEITSKIKEHNVNYNLYRDYYKMMAIETRNPVMLHAYCIVDYNLRIVSGEDISNPQAFYNTSFLSIIEIIQKENDKT